MLLSPQPHPLNRLPKNPPLLQLLLQPLSHEHPLTSSCIFVTPFYIFLYHISMQIIKFMLQ